MDASQVPAAVPVGLHLTRVARLVSRAFDDALARAGGSLPAWLVLLNLKISPGASQRELADAVGVREPTLTQQLNAMEKDGLLSRRRDPANRRIHIVELSEAGNALFLALRDAAVSFDARLRHGFAPDDLDRLGLLLDGLARNAAAPAGGPAPGRPAGTTPASGRASRAARQPDP